MNTKTRTLIFAAVAFVATLVLTLLIGYFAYGTADADDAYPEGITAETAVKKLADDPVTPAELSPEDFDTIATNVCTRASELTDRGPDDTAETYKEIVDAARTTIDENKIDVKADDAEAVAGSIAGLSISMKCPQYLTVPLV